MKTLKKIFTIAFVLLAFTLTTNAQNGNGNADGDYTGETGNNITEGSGSEGGNCGHGPNAHAGNACGGSNTSIPLDGGLSILLAGAAFFGIKKLRQK